MKTFRQIFAVIIVFFSVTVNSQNTRPITELLDLLSENHMGSVTEVFTLEELQIIKEHYTETTKPYNSVGILENIKYSSTQSVSTVQAVDIESDNISAVQVIRNSPIAEFPGGGVHLRGTPDPTNEPPRIIVIDNNGHLWQRETGDGPVTITDMGELTGIPSGHSITGIEVLRGPAARVIYGTSTNGVDDTIVVTINPDNLTVTPVGGNNGLTLPISLARNEDNELFTIDIDDDKLYKLDKTTGAATEVGPLGSDFNFGQAMFYDEFSKKIVSLSYNAAVGDSQMFLIDHLTGIATSQGTIQPGTIQQFGWADAYNRDLLDVKESEIDGFSFYPNPAKNYISVRALKNIETIEIFSVLGSIIIKQVIGKTKEKIDISELSSGAYILRVSTAKQSGIYKLIKK